MKRVFCVICPRDAMGNAPLYHVVLSMGGHAALFCSAKDAERSCILGIWCAGSDWLSLRRFECRRDLSELRHEIMVHLIRH